MLTIDDAFPSKYLKASDLPEEGSVSATIEKIQIEEVGKDKQQKPVIYFEEFDRALVCNKTNANTIARLTGSRDLHDWVGTVISLYRAEVEAFGEMVESIRVKAKQPSPKPHRAVEINEPSSKDEPDDIPF